MRQLTIDRVVRETIVRRDLEPVINLSGSVYALMYNKNVLTTIWQETKV